MNTTMKHLLFSTEVTALSGALATTVNLAPPAPSAFADTESAVTYPLAGWDDLTRFYSLSMEVETNTVSCVQVAFGTDRNSDGDLAPEETAFVAGYDCGAWFAREESNVDAMVPIACNRSFGNSTHAIGKIASTLDLAPIFDPAWNAVKVTMRGTAGSPTVTVEFKNNPMRIVVR